MSNNKKIQKIIENKERQKAIQQEKKASQFASQPVVTKKTKVKPRKESPKIHGKHDGKEVDDDMFAAYGVSKTVKTNTIDDKEAI